MMKSKTTPPPAIEAYLARFPPDIQHILASIRAAVKEAAPEAEERISYSMPGYYLNGYLVGFGAYKRHIGLYPKTEKMLASIPELSAYAGTKGSLHFPLDQPMPLELIRKIIQVRVSENQLKREAAKR